MALSLMLCEVLAFVRRYRCDRRDVLLFADSRAADSEGFGHSAAVSSDGSSVAYVELLHQLR